MDYKLTPQSGNGYTHLWDVSTIEVYDGGFLLDKSNLPANMKAIPRGAFLAVDLEERKASVVKTVALQEAITASTTTVKVKKNSLFAKNDVVGVGSKFVTVGDINTSDSDFDSFEITANALGAVAVEAVLQSFKDGKAMRVDGFNYADVKIDAEPSVSVIFKVYKVEFERLPFPITDEIIASLKHCQILKK
jgi:hypothetical protein